MNARISTLGVAFVLVVFGGGVDSAASADELTLVVQQELLALGYDPGTADGEATTKTAIAVSQFQAAKGLEVTGEITPQLAGILRAVARGRYRPAPQADSPRSTLPSASSTPAGLQDSGDLQARRQACLQEKVEAKQQRKKKKRGFGRLARAAGRVASRFGLGAEVGALTQEIYTADATAADLAAAAEDLGLTVDEVESCRYPEGEVER